MNYPECGQEMSPYTDPDTGKLRWCCPDCGVDRAGRRSRKITAAWIALLLVLVLAFALWGIGAATAAPMQAPFIYSMDHGLITVWHPFVCGYDSGYLRVLNTRTGEEGAIYLTWKGCDGAKNVYQTDPIQFIIMGSGTYIIESGVIGYQEITGLPTPFSFQVRRVWLAGVMK